MFVFVIAYASMLVLELMHCGLSAIWYLPIWWIWI